MKLLKLNRIKHQLLAIVLLVVGQTNTTTTSFDITPIINVVVAVIPLFVLIMVIKLLFQSFKNVGQ